jgi:hypothetical protein
MKLKRLLLGTVLVLVGGAAGCMRGLDKTSNIPRSSGEEYMNFRETPGTLFPTDEAVLGGANIEQILSSKLALPQKGRLVVLPFGGRPTWDFWSDELEEAERNLETGALAKLRACPRLSEVSLIPPLMMPQKQSIPYLREAAARLQADLLLVYRRNSRVYERVRIFAADKVRSKCLVEAILLDVRTGIVPFAAQSTQHYQTQRTKTESEWAETVAKAELKAYSLGLEAVAADVVTFLQAAP